MNHDAAHDKLLELEYGELSPREAREVAAHAEGCAGCREALAGIRETRALMSGLPAEPAPERGEAILMAAAREAAAARRPRTLLPSWLWAGAAGAMAAAVVAVVSWQLAGSPGAGPREARQDDLLGGAPAAATAEPGPGPGLARARGPEAGPDVAASGAAQPAAEVQAEVASAPPPAAAPAKSAAPARATKEALAPASPAPPERARKLALEAEAPALAEGARAKREAPDALAEPPAPSAAWRSVPADAEEGTFGGSVASAPVPAPAPAASAVQPPAARQAARSAATAERKAAAPAMAEAREEAMRDAVAPEGSIGVAVETRDAPGCNGEIRRIVERDAAGRVVRYVRVGERREIDQRYGPDGRLVAAYEIIGLVTRPLPLDAPGLVLLARDARIDAPLRCGAP